ncbi:MAG: threonine-phosphate decarboxylase [Rhizobiales bacterium]|nr:threonine-phosphate decarboxylase [Hyphomicrobiales bacterium]
MKHGGDLSEAMTQFGGAPDAWLDLSTGISPNPYPLPPLPRDVWQCLPSRADEAALLAAARRAYAVPDNIGIVAAPGTQALIQWLPRLAAHGAVAIVSPTYNEHAAAWQLAGHEAIAVGAIEEMPEAVRHVVIVNPNNPVGRVVDHALLARVAEQIAARDGVMVIDEAFADLDPAISAVALCERWPVVVLRSFGKFYGLAGLRLGFAIGPQRLIARISEAMGPWICSGPALAVGRVALEDERWASETRDKLREQAAKLDAVLQTAGFAAVGGTALFRLVRHRHASAYHTTLARQRIWCRRFDWADDLLRFGLPPNDAALERLALALADI